MAEPSWTSEAVALLVGVPVRARPVVLALLVISPVKVGLLTMSTVMVLVALATLVRLLLLPLSIETVPPAVTFWLVPLVPARVKSVPLRSLVSSELLTKLVPLPLR